MFTGGENRLSPAEKETLLTLSSSQVMRIKKEIHELHVGDNNVVTSNLRNYM